MELASACLDATVTALLLRAGAAKVVSPLPSAVAVGELRPGGHALPRWVIRALAVVELVTGVAVAEPALRLPAHVSVAVLGVLFAGTGLLGLIRGSGRPCGCFGGSSEQPLGVRSIVFGLTFVISAAVDLSTGGSPAGYAALLAVTISTSWLLISHTKRLFDQVVSTA